MEVEILHAVPRPLEEVERTLLDPRFAATLATACPALAEGRVLDYAVSGDVIERVAWFRAAPRYLAGPFARLTTIAWTERVRWSLREHEGRFEVTPEVSAVLARRVTCSGRYALTSREGHTERRVVVSLVVRAPLLGELAERALADLLRVVFDSEAEALSRAPGTA